MLVTSSQVPLQVSGANYDDMVQAAFGWSVTLKCVIRRRSLLKITRINRTLKLAVGTVRKSSEMSSLE